MSFVDRFLSAIKLNDDYDDDEDFLDDEEEEEEDEELEESRPRRRFFSRFSTDEDAEEEGDFSDDSDFEVPARERRSRKIAPSRRERRPEPARPAREETPRREYGRPARKNKVTPITRKKNAVSNMEVNVIRPSSMEDTRDIADTLMNNFTVVLNLEGLDVDIAQRVIDFTCGVCYSLNGNLQKVSSYIFILTPSNVDISGDFQSILNGAFDIPSMSSQY